MSQKWRIPEWFPTLDGKALERLKEYNDSLTKWTSKINLISPGTVAEADRIHFADGVLGLEVVLQSLRQNLDGGQEIFDLGSGNGIPGVVLSILRPDFPVCCLDSDERKIGFIKQLGLRLDLENLRTLCARLENVGPQTISLATARGFAPLKKALEIAGPSFRSKGTIYHFKGQEYQKELSELSEQIKNLWETVVIGEYDLPLEGGTRVILKSIRK